MIGGLRVFGFPFLKNSGQIPHTLPSRSSSSRFKAVGNRNWSPACNFFVVVTNAVIVIVVTIARHRQVAIVAVITAIVSFIVVVTVIIPNKYYASFGLAFCFACSQVLRKKTWRILVNYLLSSPVLLKKTWRISPRPSAQWPRSGSFTTFTRRTLTLFYGFDGKGSLETTHKASQAGGDLLMLR